MYDDHKRDNAGVMCTILMSSFHFLGSKVLRFYLLKVVFRLRDARERNVKMLENHFVDDKFVEHYLGAGKQFVW